jgi:hypothetical protein
MPTVSTPVLAYVSALLAGAGVAQSSSLTVTVHLTSGWEIQIPVQFQCTTVSADPSVIIYSSSDGGVSYDTTSFSSFSIARVANSTTQASIRLPVGQYVLQLLNSGPNTATFYVQTAQVLTAILNN